MEFDFHCFKESLELQASIPTNWTPHQSFLLIYAYGILLDFIDSIRLSLNALPALVLHCLNGLCQGMNYL